MSKRITMALEALLPSEVARLVYGYLVNEKCTGAAEAFLNASSNLEECRTVVSYGRGFTTRVCGHSLTDILDKFCNINSLVQDTISQHANLNELKQCSDLTSQIKFILDKCRSEPVVYKVDASTQIPSIVPSEPAAKYRKRHLSFDTDEERLNQIIEKCDKLVQTEIPISEPISVQTTLLKNLPGYVNNLENVYCQVETSRLSKISDENTKVKYQKDDLQETQKKKFPNKCFKQYVNSDAQTSAFENYEKVDKSIMTDLGTKLKNRTSEISSPDSGICPTDECVELLASLTRELLNRTEIQKIIACNINRILESKKSTHLFENPIMDGTKENISRSFIIEFQKAVETALNKTENDPDILNLINEVTQSRNEIIITEDENMEVDNFIEQQDIIISKARKIDNNINKETVLINNDLNQNNETLKKRSFNDELNNATNRESIKVNDNPLQVVLNSMPHEHVSLTEKGFKVPSNIENNCEKSSKGLSNHPESQELQQKPMTTSDDFFSLNSTITSTPLKTYTAEQGFDTCDWLSIEALQTPDTLLKTHRYTASEAVVTTKTSLISPIMCKDASDIIEKAVTINCSSANELKHKTLNTPDVVLSPKRDYSNSKKSTFNTNVVPNKNPIIQKNVEVTDELHNFDTTQKSNGIRDNCSFLSNEKLFGSESIMLYGMENNVTALPTLISIPEIEIDDSIALSGTGLSPFLKINKKSSTQNEKNDQLPTNNVVTDQWTQPGTITKTNKNESPKSIQVTNISTTDIITKQTPKALEENRMKNNRISMSTPKKPASYIRALNFETPVIRSQSESKVNENSNRSPRSIMADLKNACKSSLFQSPEITNEEIIEQNTDHSEYENKTQISTDLNKLEIQNKKNSKNVKDNSGKKTTEDGTSLKNVTIKNTVTVGDIKKKRWDEDLRTLIGQAITVEEEPSKKSKKKKSKNNKKDKDKNTPKKAKKNKKTTPKKSEKIDTLTLKKSKKNDKKTPAKSKTTDKKISKTSKNNEKSELCDDKKQTILKEANSETEKMKLLAVLSSSKDENDKTTNDVLSDSILEALLSDSVNEDNAISANDVMKLAAEEIDNRSKLSHNESVGKTVLKDDQNIVEKMQHDEEIMTAAFEESIKPLATKISLEKETEQISKNIKPEEVKNFVDYKKLDRQLQVQENVIAPQITSTIMFTNSTNNQKAEVIYDQVSKIERGQVVQKKYARLQTLDTKITSKSDLKSFATEIELPCKEEEMSLQIPPTPRILSPGSSCSFLMMPVSKLGDESQIRNIRSCVMTPLECPLTPEIVLTPPKSQDENTAEALQKVTTSSYFQPTLATFKASKEAEITQFEVIKENLKGSTPKSQSQCENTTENVLNSQIISDNTSEKNEKSSITTSYVETAVSEHQHTLSSSSCSSSSCSCCASSTVSSEEVHKNNNNDNELDSSSENVLNDIEVSQNKTEISPTKVFSIKKTDKEIEESIKETPAKDENTCIEMSIFDTPNVSKSAENPTNLNTKISQMMIIKEKEEIEKQYIIHKSKPKIINVQRILPKVITQPSIQFIKAQPLNMQKQDEIQNEPLNKNSLFERIKIHKSEEEVAQAIESITNENHNFNKSLEKTDDNVILSPVDKNDYLDNSNNKGELAKAIQSITNFEVESPKYSPIKMVLTEEEQTISNEYISNKTEISINSDYSEDPVASDSEQDLTDTLANWSNLNATCSEIHFEANDYTYAKKRRRKRFTDEELESYFYEPTGLYHANQPTNFDMIYELKPPRKKREVKPVDSQKSSSTTSSAVVVHNKKEGSTINKRKRTNENEPILINSKRKKNIFIY